MPRTIEDIYPSKGDSDFHQIITGERIDRLAPFVLFDAVTVKTDSQWGFGWHAHSGVATLTYLYAATLNHEDTASGAGVIEAGGFQWMQAGGGIWHKEMLDAIDGFVGAHQLWVQLPPAFEEGENCYFDVAKGDLPKSGNTKILIGQYGDGDAGKTVPVDMTYLDVALDAGEIWHFDAPNTQKRGFVFPRQGDLMVEGVAVTEGSMGVFVDADDAIVISATSPAKFVIALTALPDFPMVKAYGQIHTTEEALQRSTDRIKALEASVPGRAFS